MESPVRPLKAGPRQFDFARDSFAFENETFWEYHFDTATGKTSFSKREPKPHYGHRCFVLTRAARQFLFHVRFDETQTPCDDPTCRRLIRAVMARNPRARAEPGRQIVIPGYADLRSFSQARGSLLKAQCGGAWQSYVLRSHWRMVFPISRAHQVRTAASLERSLEQSVPPIIHLVKFPSLTINHSMILFASAENGGSIEFQTYDPNNPAQPAKLVFDHKTRGFSLPPNRYWAGGAVDVIEIYRNWLM